MQVLNLFFQTILQANASDLKLKSQEIRDSFQRLYVWYSGSDSGLFVRLQHVSANGDNSRTNSNLENWNRWFNVHCILCAINQIVPFYV